jgi:GNAT superfamily N-acetyltransferase
MTNAMLPFADHALSRRLERAEAHACAQFAEARRRFFPESGSAWIECAGAYAVFDGIDSPITQTFGLGMFEELTPKTLDIIERFFRDHHAPIFHEVSPHAGVAALNLLCERGYRPIEISNVLYRLVERPATDPDKEITVRVTGHEEAPLWTDISTRGWAHEHPELLDFISQIGGISSARKDSVCFLAEIDGKPGAAGVLCLHEGVALFGGAATVPELRRKGLQTALLRERMRYAAGQGCDLAMMVTLPGSESQRNAERRGFQIAYTRTKWQLHSEP